SGDVAEGCSVTVDAGSRFRRTLRFRPEDALLGDNRLALSGAELSSGPLEITLTRDGRDEVYFTAWLRAQGDEEGIRGTEGDLRRPRRYFRLSRSAPNAATPKDAPLTPDGYLRAPLRTGESVPQGEQIEVELVLESTNGAEYLLLEDARPAGFEAVAGG